MQEFAENFIIKGGRRLSGAVEISGAKNAAVAILPAAILCEDSCTIENLPQIEDVLTISRILNQMGAESHLQPGGKMVVDTSGVINRSVDYPLVRTMRASYYFAGALLGRFGHAKVMLPGGCMIGQRPIDQHIKGLRALGAEVSMQGGFLIADAPDGLQGTEVYLDVVSVGATINIMLAAARAQGLTTIVNAAKEPHVVDLANFLNSMGASVKGAGTDIIRIKGKSMLHGCTYSIIPDQIEAGTLMIAAAATQGDVVLKNVITTHLEGVIAKLIEMGVHVEEGEDYIRVQCDQRPRCANIKTMPYPGFPTDLQQPMSVLLCYAQGTSMIVENIFEDRFKHVGELRRMGANISTNQRVAVIEGVPELTGTYVAASDLRAGAALVIAGLMAQGTTRIGHIEYIDRGYEQLEQKLITLGADIVRSYE